MDGNQSVVELFSQLEMLNHEIAKTQIQIDEIETMSRFVRRFKESLDASISMLVPVK